VKIVEEQQTKTWKTVGTYNDYNDAAAKKSELCESYQEIKIKRGGKDGDIFRVKAWNPPGPKKQNKKKGKKNANKKIRS
tara:strand:- start:64789 stop:65025 length:237 start_codon:yes stop_codon:yes gene_type:complete